MTEYDPVVDLSDHDIGNPNCRACWMDTTTICKHCGGIVHEEFGDDWSNYEGYWTVFKCEGCGSTDPGDSRKPPSGMTYFSWEREGEG